MKNDYILPVGLVLVVFFAFYTIFSKFGFFDNEEKERNEKKQKQRNKNVVRDVLNNTKLDVEQTTEQKVELHNLYERFLNAFGLFNDNEEIVEQIFYEMPTRKSVRAFSKYFQEEKDESLFSFLVKRLSQNELSNVLNIINKKP